MNTLIEAAVFRTLVDKFTKDQLLNILKMDIGAYNILLNSYETIPSEVFKQSLIDMNLIGEYNGIMMLSPYVFFTDDDNDSSIDLEELWDVMFGYAKYASLQTMHIAEAVFGFTINITKKDNT